jgi:hypothetical protein
LALGDRKWQIVGQVQFEIDGTFNKMYKRFAKANEGLPFLNIFGDHCRTTFMAVIYKCM